MSSIGRRQTNADEKFDLSKKTIRDVAVELARRAQQFPDAENKPDTAGPDTPAPAQEAAPNPADNPTPSPSNLIQMDPRAPRGTGTNLWSLNRPFSEDAAGRAPLEALSRALDHKHFEQQDEIGLTPSSEMTTDLAPAPMVVPPSSSHPTVDGDELPLQESVKTPTPSENTPPSAPSRPAIRHYPAPHFSIFSQLRGIWLRRTLHPTRRSVSAPMQAADIRWSTLAAGVVIGLAAGAGAVALLHPTSMPAPPMPTSTANAPAVNPAETTATAPSTEAPAMSASLSTAPLPTAPLPATPSSVSPAAPSAVEAPSAPVGMTVALHPRDMTATTFGIPVALQAGKSPNAEGSVTPSPPTDATGASAGANASASNPITPAPTTALKPAKPVKTKAKPTQKSSSGQHAPTTEQLSPAKR